LFAALLSHVGECLFDVCQSSLWYCWRVSAYCTSQCLVHLQTPEITLGVESFGIPLRVG